MEKPFELYASELISGITQLAVLVNMTTDYYTGFEYYAHVNLFELTIAPSRPAYMGDEEGREKFGTYLDGIWNKTDEGKQETLDKLKQMGKKLETILLEAQKTEVKIG